LATDRFDTILRILHLSRPRLRRIGPPGTCRTACCTSPAFLAAFRNETHRRKKRFRSGCCPVLPNRRLPVSDRSHSARLVA
jgi:hypothetical protein